MIASKFLRSSSTHIWHRSSIPLITSRTVTTLRETYSKILVSREDGGGSGGVGHLGVGIITLNQPKTLNALSDALFDDLIHASKAFDDMEDIGSIVITGKGKAFAAGADIQEMSTREFAQVYKSVCTVRLLIHTN